MANEEETVHSKVHSITHAKVLFDDIKKPQIVLSSKIRLLPQIKGDKLKRVTFTNKKEFKKEANVYACEVSRCAKTCTEDHKHYDFRQIRVLALGGKVSKKKIQF